MSWIFGVVAPNLPPGFLSTLSAIHDPPLHRHVTGKLYIAAGGIGATCLGNPESPTNPWLVVGCGIRSDGERAVQLSSRDWQTILSSPNPDFLNLDGHFVAITWNGSNVRCFNDLFGMRTLYAAPVANGTAFSTRLDWLAKLKGGLDIDFGAFGGHWLSFNALSHESLVAGVKRMGPDSRGIIEPDSITINDNLWEPDLSELDSRNVTEVLQRHLRFRPYEELAMSFGLSGGLDSRLLLALLISSEGGSYSLHLFGHASEPDVQVAGRIGRDLRLQQDWFFEPLPAIDDCLVRMNEYVAQSQLIGPASAFLKLGGS